MQRKLGAALAFIIALTAPASALAEAGANAAVEATVRAYFADMPVMIDIARCESEFREYASDGAALRGGYKHSMIGIFQIASLHIPDARARGFDLETIAGNIAYARRLYEAEGAAPWIDSSPCWSEAPAYRSASDDAGTAATIAILERKVAELAALLDALRAARTAS